MMSVEDQKKLRASIQAHAESGDEAAKYILSLDGAAPEPPMKEPAPFNAHEQNMKTLADAGNQYGVPLEASPGPAPASLVPQAPLPNPMAAWDSPEITQLQKQLMAKFGEQQKTMDEDVRKQRAYSTLSASRDPGRDISPTLAYFYNLAGRSPADTKSSLDAAKPADYNETDESLRKGLAAVVGSQDKLNDNQIAELKLKLGFAGDKAKMNQANQSWKRLTEFQKKIDPAQASGRNGIGSNYKVIQGVEKALAIPLTTPLKEITPQQTTEVFSALANVVNGTGGSSEHQRQQLMPTSFKGDWANFKQYVTNHPQSAQSQEFVANAMHMLERERTGAKYRLASTIHGILPAYADVMANPMTAAHAKEMLSRMGVDPDKAPEAPIDYSDEGVKKAVDASKSKKSSIPTDEEIDRMSAAELKARFGSK